MFCNQTGFFSSFKPKTTGITTITITINMPILHRNPFPNAVSRTTLFVHDALIGSDMTYMVFRRPTRQLSSGMAVLIILYIAYPPIAARLGRIVSTRPRNFIFRIHCDSHQINFLLVPADWVQLSFLESIRFHHFLRTPSNFMAYAEDSQSEANVTTTSVIPVTSQLRPSISMPTITLR
jgi:hypothetical protein